MTESEPRSQGPALIGRGRLTIVTVCMNRREHLLQTAARVAGWPWHDCHLILDWSSDEPLRRDELPGDRRIRLERMEGEAEWCLARAYNAAIRLADGDWILKLDADCWPTDRWHEPLRQLDARTLRIGEGPRGRNGQFLMARRTFLEAGGFHELMRGWGFEDKDLRLRLQRLHGCQLLALPIEALGVIDHDDSLRAGLQRSGLRWPAVALHRRGLAEARIRASMLANRLTAALAPWSAAVGACRYAHDERGAWRLVPDSLPRLPAAARREVEDARRIVFWARFLAIPEVLIEQMPFSLFPAWRADPDVRWWHRLYWYGLRWIAVLPAQLLSIARIVLLHLLGRTPRVRP